MRELQILLQRLGFIVSGGNTIGMYNFFAQWGERETAYVSRSSRLAASGWEAVDIVFGDDVPVRMIRDLEREMRDGYRFRYFTVTRVGGRRVWIMTLQRLLKLSGVSGGAAPTPPTPELPKWLNFTLDGGGTLKLTRFGTPELVDLECSTDDGNTWYDWDEVGNERTKVIAEGERFCIRNKSAISTRFSNLNSGTYRFQFSADADAGGSVNSIICQDPDQAVLTSGCFFRLFVGSTLRTPPELPSLTLASGCYQEMFGNCQKLTESPLLPAEQPASMCYMEIFKNSHNLKKIRINLKSLTTLCLQSWTQGVAAAGDFYCPAELTIPTGASGIPSGWTRHDI